MNRKFINLGGYINEVLDHSPVGSVDKNLVIEKNLDPPGMTKGKPALISYIKTLKHPGKDLYYRYSGLRKDSIILSWLQFSTL